jgi:putative ABC transport system permease protein
MRTPAWRRYLRFWGSNVPSDVDEELRFHLEMRVAEYTARGMPPADARRVAERRFGDEQKARAECIAIDENAARAMSRGASLASLGQDIRYATRLLRRQAAPASLAVLCLALGVGATTAMFSVADALLIRPLPFPSGNRLFLVTTTRDRARDADVTSYPDYLDWRARQHSFSELAAFGQTSFPVVLSRPVRANAAIVTANFFRALGVLPEHGRLFTDDEDQGDGAPVAVVSHGFAEREMGRVDRAVGSTISVRGIPRVVVGVVPDGRSIPTGGDLWLPLPRDLDRGLSGHMSSRVNRSNRGLQVLGLLAPTVTIDQARSEYDALERELVREHPADDAGLTTKITPLREVYVGFARPMLVAMLAATLLVLLVACANVAGIQLARATSRVREIAVRSAIGAGRARVLRQLLTESVILALAGGALGIALAYRSSEFAEVAVLGQSPSWLMPSVDVRVLAFAVTVSMLTGIVFGVAPAMRLTRVDPADALRGGRSALGGGPSRGRLQQLFVVVQMALSIVLVVAAGLSIESVRRVEELPLGFDERGALMFTATLQTPRYDVAGERARFADALDRRASGLPGVTIAGATSLPPFRCCSKWALGIDGQPLPDDQKLMVPGNSVTPGYFEAMGIPLVRGRAFAGTDAADATPVMVINESFAHRFWPNGEAIGHLVHDGNDHATIVGIVRDVKIVLTEPPGPQFYRPFAQKPVTTLTFVLRTPTGDPGRFTADIRRIVHDLDPTLPLYGFTTASAMVDFQFAGRRTFESLMIAFGVIALLLATMGIYGVTSFFVSQRTQELGLRVALGADPGRLLALVLRSSAAMAFVGGLVGLGGAFLAARWLSHTLYGVGDGRPAIYVVAAGLLAAGTLVASIGPANRAARADPMTTLRVE